MRGERPTLPLVSAADPKSILAGMSSVHVPFEHINRERHFSDLHFTMRQSTVNDSTESAASLKIRGRRAGLLYLSLAVIAPFTDIIFPRAFIVANDAAATARNIAAAPLTYRIGILGGLTTNIIMLFVALSLYDLLKDVDKRQARLMVSLVLVGVCIAIVNVFNLIAPLVLLSGADFLSAFTKPQLDALALGFLRMRGIGLYVATVFWGLWLFPFGVLVIRSRFIPKALGVLLVVGCFAYLTLSVTELALPAYGKTVLQLTLPFYSVGELSIIAWLCVKGAVVRETERDG